MLDIESLSDFFFDEPWKRITAACAAGATVLGGGAYMWNANKHIYMMRSAAAEQTLTAVRKQFGREWGQGESHFDIPELNEDASKPYRRQFFDATRDIGEDTALARPHVRGVLATTRTQADGMRSNARLTGSENFIHHRALTACHPTDWNCQPIYREGVEVKVQYKYTTRDWECVSHNAKGCTRHAYVTNTRYRWHSNKAMELDITGEGPIGRVPQARFMYNAMADARNFALHDSEGAKLSRERKAFHQPIVDSRHLREPGAIQPETAPSPSGQW